jgi:putative two-component system response regulator
MLQDPKLLKEYEDATGSPFTDSLTGLYNHGVYQIVLDREIERSQRFGDPFSLCFIDLDAFSQYNRRHDPVKADTVLKEIGRIISQNIRDVDVGARYSGDIFAVVFSNTDTKSAMVAIERIRTAVNNSFKGDPTISVGVVGCPKDGITQETLTAKASKALIKAKTGGKDRVYFFETEDQPSVQQQPKVLIVDDEPRNIKLLKAMLLSTEFEIFIAENGEDALSIIRKTEVDLVLLDIMMPGMDGYEVCRRIKGNESTRLIPVILITALDDMDSKVKGIEAGADDFLTKPPNRIELITRVKSLVRVKFLNNNLTSIENVLFSLANAVEAKDVYTQGHIQRVATLSRDLAKRMNFSQNDIEAIRLGGILHDIGKIGIAANILNKPGPLDPEEWEEMMTHPDAGYRICRPLEKNLGAAVSVIRHHHEKLDGSGYPDGLKGDDIPLTSQLMAVVDIYDALVTDRPYRKAMPREKAFSILREESETGKLNKDIVSSLIEMIENGNRGDLTGND